MAGIQVLDDTPSMEDQATMTEKHIRALIARTASDGAVDRAPITEAVAGRNHAAHEAFWLSMRTKGKRGNVKQAIDAAVAAHTHPSPQGEADGAVDVAALVARLRGHYEHGIGSDDIEEAAAVLSQASARVDDAREIALDEAKRANTAEQRVAELERQVLLAREERDAASKDANAADARNRSMRAALEREFAKCDAEVRDLRHGDASRRGYAWACRLIRAAIADQPGAPTEGDEAA